MKPATAHSNVPAQVAPLRSQENCCAPGPAVRLGWLRQQFLRAPLPAGLSLAQLRLVLLLALLPLLGLTLRAAEQRPLAEHQVQALYLFNFLKYVDWPAEAFNATNAPYTIGVVASPEIYKDLQEVTHGKHINDREVLVRLVEQAEEVRNCHVLFFPAASNSRFRQAAAQFKDAPILTVGEAEDFLAQGGAIRFVRQQDKLRLEINLETAQRARLAISAKLLALAKVLKGRAGQAPN